MKTCNLEYSPRWIRRVMGFVLVAGVVAMAGPQERSNAHRPDDGHCSNVTLAGDYIWAAQGLASPGPQLPPQAPFSAVGTARFDGQGNFSWLERTIIAGHPQGADWTMATGYLYGQRQLHSLGRCTHPEQPVPLSLALVVLKNGTEARMVVNSHAINTVFIRND